MESTRSKESRDVNGSRCEVTPTSGRRRRPRGVLLLNLGTPDEPTLSAVRRYLVEFLRDPEVIRLPTGIGWFNGPLARLIAHFRGPASAHMYQTVWTDQGSPLMAISRDLTQALEEGLPDGWRVFCAMRYGNPSIPDTLREIESAGIDELVVLPMYPQFSGPTTGTALRELFGCLKRTECRVNVTTRSLWFDDGGYINAQAKLIHEYAKAQRLTPKNCHLLFSAHGLPVSYVERGDPYPRHVRKTVDLVLQRLGWPSNRASVAYQSRFGPAEWLTPATDEVLPELVRGERKRVLVCPVSFTTDCLETLEELGIRYRALTAEHGGMLYLCPALNTYAPFVSAIKDIVLRGPSPVTTWSESVRPLMAPAPQKATNAEIPSLVMIGTSLGNRFGAGCGPNVAHTDATGLRGVKRSQVEVPDLLRAIRDDVGLTEGWLWNTCNRFEFYGWLKDTEDRSAREQAAAKIAARLGGQENASTPALNVLFGADAWHHLLRTAAGLNSQLPGERDIVEQLEAAHRLANTAGMAGPLSGRLLIDVKALVEDLRKETDWGRYDPDYCHAALSRIAPKTGLEFAECQGVVIGGSTTSASVLRTLIGRFNTPSKQLTLVYRGHSKGGQLKMLRKCIGNGRRLRVGEYGEPQVAKAVAEADVVIFGVDREQPVLCAEQLRGLRDFAARPLTVIDFNMFGSTAGLETIEGVRLFVARDLESETTRHADEMCGTAEFGNALAAAEEWIGRQVRAAAPTNPNRSTPTDSNPWASEAFVRSTRS